MTGPADETSWWRRSRRLVHRIARDAERTAWIVVVVLAVAVLAWVLRLGEATMWGWMLTASLSRLLLGAAPVLLVAAVLRRRKRKYA